MPYTKRLNSNLTIRWLGANLADAYDIKANRMRR